MSERTLDYWRAWLAEQLVYGCSASKIKQVLLSSSSLDEITIDEEIGLAQKSPYIKGGKRVAEIYNKREWLLKTLDELEGWDEEYPKIDIVEEAPSYENFKINYLSKNKPLLIRGGANHWKAMNWTFESLKEKVGNVQVEILDGRDKNPNFELEKDKHATKITMANFIDRILKSEVSNDFYMTANNAKNVTKNLIELTEDYAQIGDGYIDMSRDAILSRSSFWIGPKGTKTPLHYDRMNNIFVQIHGKKQVQLVHPFQIPYMYNHNFVFSSIKYLDDYDTARYPQANKVTPVQVEVGAGDVLFIPVSWYHYVKSIENSISHTFLNLTGIKNHYPGFPNPVSLY